MLSGCFAQSGEVPESGTEATTSDETGLDTGLDTGGSAPMTESDGTTDSAESTGPDSADTTTGCEPGTVDCSCLDDACEGDAVCAMGMCVPLPAACGNGELDDREECDDGNNAAQDGCSATCTWEPQCFVGHVGGGGPMVQVRTVRIAPDGTMSNLGSTDIPGAHQVPEHPAGHWSGAAVGCGGFGYLAMADSGSIVTVGVDGDETEVIAETPVDSFVGVRELACDPMLGVVLAAAVEGAGVSVARFEMQEDGSLMPAGVPWEFEDADFLAAESVHLALDRSSQRAHVVFTEAGVSQIPTSHARLDYAVALDPVPPPGSGLVLNNFVYDATFFPASSQLLVAGRRAGSDYAVGVIDLDGEGAWDSFETLLRPPWSTRANVTALRLPGGATGSAMGGTTGVVLARFTAGQPEQVGLPVAESLDDTLARPLFEGRVLLVASPMGFETYDLRQEPDDGVWPQLSSLGVGAPPTFQAGALVPCP